MLTKGNQTDIFIIFSNYVLRVDASKLNPSLVT